MVGPGSEPVLAGDYCGEWYRSVVELPKAHRVGSPVTDDLDGRVVVGRIFVRFDQSRILGRKLYFSVGALLAVTRVVFELPVTT